MRRARSPHFVDAAWQTPAETRARQALADLEATYAVDHTRLEGELNAATAAAEPIRYGMLYGTGGELEDAVGTVLRAAGFTVVNLDDELGGTESADLLATYWSELRLVEVKSTSGNAPEKLVGSLERHLATWPSLRPDDPVGGGVLVVNHQHRRDPGERSAQVYERAAFVDSLTVEVLEISVSSADFGQLGPMIAAAEGELTAAGITNPPEVALADAGYWHGEQIDELTGRGIQVLIPPDSAKRQGTRPGWSGGRYAFMRRVLQGEIAGELYRKRQVMIEPVFADTKYNRRIDRFLRRGRSAARSEWRLITASGNLLKLHRHRLRLASP